MGNEEVVAAGVLGGMFAAMMIAMLVLWVLLIIARWKVFTKAGEAGWKSIIPIYADYVQWRIGWTKTGLFWVYIALIIVGYIVLGAGGYDPSATSAAMTASGNPVLIGIGTVMLLAAVVLGYIAAYKLFRSFGRGAGWLVLYIFFAPFVLMALGFGSVQYEGAVD